jgi:hypothetical protein
MGSSLDQWDLKVKGGDFLGGFLHKKLVWKNHTQNKQLLIPGVLHECWWDLKSSTRSLAPSKWSHTLEASKVEQLLERQLWYKDYLSIFGLIQLSKPASHHCSWSQWSHKPLLGIQFLTKAKSLPVVTPHFRLLNPVVSAYSRGHARLGQLQQRSSQRHMFQFQNFSCAPPSYLCVVITSLRDSYTQSACLAW